MPPRTANAGARHVVRTAFRCSECGTSTGKWAGRCPQCQGWGTLTEVGAPRAGTVSPGPVTLPARPIGDVDVAAARPTATGLAELDRVLGGGLVPGAVVLLAGEPGVGKSTLLLDVAHRFASPDSPVLLVSGEESAAQVRLRAQRMGTLSPHLFLAAETELAALFGHIEAVAPRLLVVDSVQTFTHPDVDGAAGGVTQVREVAAALSQVAKQRGLPVVLVGHVTKDGAIAGPRVLEHLVDVVLSFEGDPHAGLRMLRAVKNRFGATDEVGCFELTDDGIVELPDPSGLFLAGGATSSVGNAVTVTLDGRRALISEVQALLVPTGVSFPRRAVSGVDAARVAMLLAVLIRHGGLPVADHEVYASTVGGVKLTDPAADLGLLLAMAGSSQGSMLPDRSVVVGEVGLDGHIRPVRGLPRRLAEASRLGFCHALVPAGTDTGALPAGLRLTKVEHVLGALSQLQVRSDVRLH